MFLAARGVGCSQPTLYVLLPRERLLAQGFHTTCRRALAIGLAFSFLGDTGLLEWALESPILAGNASDPLSRYERISPRLSFTEYDGLSMSSEHRWSRMYRNTGGGQGEVVLMLMRPYPKKKGDMRWIYVRPVRSLGSVGCRDRSRITAKRQPNTTYAHFPALSAKEKTAAIGAGTEKQLSTSGGLICFAWRAALYFRAWDWAKWTVEKLDDTRKFLMELDDFGAYLYDLYQDGRLELPMLLLSFLMVFTPVLWSWCCRRGLPRFGGASPPGSDVDSDGEAGQSVHESDSESEGSKEVSEMMKMMQDLMEEMHRDRRDRRRSELETEGISARGGGDSPRRSDGSSAWCPGSSAGSWGRIPSPADMGLHVDRMMDRLNQFERIIQADRASAPAINLDEFSMEEVEVNIGPLRESLKDPRVRLIEGLTKLKSAPTFERPPPGLTARVAPGPPVQTCGKYGSMGKFATDWVKQKELYNNHIGYEMLLHCMTLDRMLEASPDFIATAGCEILCSTVYALKRAFKDLTARLQQKALFQKYLHEAGSEPLDSWTSWQGHIHDVDVDLGAAVERVLAGQASPWVGEGVTESLGVDSKGHRVLPKSAICSIGVDELALPAPGAVPVKLIDICPLAVEYFSDTEGRVLRRPGSVLMRELESQVVYRGPALKSRGARLRLAERLWRGGVLTFTKEKKESADSDLVLQRHVRAIWDERRANLRWGSPASFTNLDLSNIEAEGRVYSAVGDMPDMFYTLERPPQCWTYFCLGEVGVDEFVLYMAEWAVDVEAPADSGFLALEVLVMGWSWAPFLAHSALQACVETALGEGSVRARMVYGPPTPQIHGEAGGCEALNWGYMDDCGVMASSTSANGPEKELVSDMAAKGLESSGAVLRGRPYVIRSCPLKTCRLAFVTLALVERACWAAAVLGRLVGLWASAAVFQRTSRAIFDQVYHEMRRPSSPAATFRLSAEARAELAAAAYCAPLMATYLESPWARQAFMTDSSDVSYGVAVTQARVEDLRAESRYCELRGWTFAAEDLYTNAEGGAWQEGCDGCAHDVDEWPRPWLQSCGEHLRRRAESAGILIEVWCLGAIIDPKHDLTDPEFLIVIVRLVDNGYFHGPWGVGITPVLDLLGTKSLMTALTVIRAVCAAGGVGLLEHPSDPGEPPYPSIWDLVELKDLVKDFGGWVNYLDQCRYGAPSMKPTLVGIFGTFAYQPESCNAVSEVIIEAFQHMEAKRLGPDVEVADATASQWAPKVRQFLNFCIQRSFQLTSESEVDRALADYMGIQCYGERKRATLGSVVLFGMLVIWPELRNKLPLALRCLKSWQKLAGTSEGGPLPEEAIYAIAIYMIEQGLYVEAVWTLTQYDVYGREQDMEMLKIADVVWDGQCRALAFGVSSRGEEVKTGTNQGAVMRRSVVANPVLGLRDFRTGKDEKLFGIDQIRRASLEQVRRRGRWKAISSVQRYSKTFALTQFRARMPEVVPESGMRAVRDLKAEIFRALRRRPRPRGSLPEALENAINNNLAKDVAAEQMKIKSSRARSSKKTDQTDDDDQDSPGGLFSDETFGEDTGWWAE
ncbi:unnamed protein product [Prorocentrum cordatum]|uniref:DNA-directed DNA polymerase n=1 Tax=Prorocentrum cordatum TaxID=2364126 RepID=A0ABN9STM7_9DINO|nr:unnamed protein product [Polarella glacialis]